MWPRCAVVALLVAQCLALNEYAGRALLATPAPAALDASVLGFQGVFAIGNWSLERDGDSSLDDESAPDEVELRGADDAGGEANISLIFDSFPRPAFVSFAWSYETEETDPAYDPFGLVFYDEFYQLPSSGLNVSVQNGSVTSLYVDEGGSFGFRIVSLEGTCGRAFAVVSEFVVEFEPEPTAGPYPAPSPAPSGLPSVVPSAPGPSTLAPSAAPHASPLPSLSVEPSMFPTKSPTYAPTDPPVTAVPRGAPTTSPTATPTIMPSSAPTFFVFVTTGIVVANLGGALDDEAAVAHFEGNMTEALDDLAPSIGGVINTEEGTLPYVSSASTLSVVTFDVTVAETASAVESRQAVREAMLLSIETGVLATIVAQTLGPAVLDVAESISYIQLNTVEAVDECANGPPLLVGAQFDSATGSTLIVSFDRDTNRANVEAGTLFDCSVLFESQLACEWTDADTVLIDATDNYDLTVGSIWTLKNNTELRVSNDCDETSPPASVQVQGPQTQVTPVVNFDAPLQISECSDLRIDVRRSTGSTGRDFSFVNWTVGYVPRGGGQVGDSVIDIIEAPALAATANSSLVLDYATDDLREISSAIKRLLVTVELVNFFGERAQDTFEVTLTQDAIPRLSIAGGTERRRVQRSRRLRINAVAWPTTCDENRTWALDYNWEISTSSGEQLPSNFSDDPRALELPEYMLEIGETYVANVTVTDNVQGTSAYALIVVTPVPSELVAVITGGDRTMGQNEIIELSAAGSVDPDVAPYEQAQSLVFAWSCRPKTIDDFGDCEEAFNVTNEPTLEIDGSRLGLENFVFAVNVSDAAATRAASASVVITHEVEPPTVLINGPSSLVVASTERLVLRGIATVPFLQTAAEFEPRTLTTRWSLEEGQLVNGVSLSDALLRADLEVSVVEKSANNCGDDDANWFSIRPERTCAWVALYSAARCDVFGAYELNGQPVRASDACSRTCTSGCDFVRVETNFVLEANQLIQTASYAFQLQATLSKLGETLTGNETAGFSRVTVLVLRSPTGGTIDVQPKSGGVALDTLFTIEAPDWVGDRVPLSYRFETNGGQVIRPSSLALGVDAVRLPPGPDCLAGATSCSLDVTVYVTDYAGATATATETIQISASTLKDEELINTTTFLLDQAIDGASNYEEACNIVVAAARTSPNSTSLLDTLASAAARARELARTDGDDDLSNDNVALFAACLAAIVQEADALLETTANELVVEINDILLSQDLSIDFASAAAQNSLDTIAQVLGSALFGVDEPEEEGEPEDDEEDRRRTQANSLDPRITSATANSALDNLHLAISKSLVADEYAATVSSTYARTSTRRSSGAQALELPAEASKTTVRLAPQAREYVAALSDVIVNVHERVGGGGGTTSETTVRLSLLSGPEATADDGTTVQLLVPRRGGTPATSTATNVTLVCPWNYRGIVSETCGPQNVTVSVQCDGTKTTHVRGCGIEAEDACVQWDRTINAWSRQYCRVNTTASNGTLTACDCVTNYTTPADAQDPLSGTDYSTRSFLNTYRIVLANEFTIGNFNARRARLVIGILSAFVLIVASLGFTGWLMDRRLPKTADFQNSSIPVGAPPSAEGPRQPSVAISDITLFVPDAEADEEDSEQRSTSSERPPSSVRASHAAVVRSSSTNARRSTPSFVARRPGLLTRLSTELDERSSLHGHSTWPWRFMQALRLKHPFIEIWTVPSLRRPRHVRVLALATEIMLIAVVTVLEQALEYPDPNCDSRKSERTCLRHKARSGRRTCKWDEQTGVCSFRQPPSSFSLIRVEELIIVLVLTAAIFPLSILYEQAVEVVYASGVTQLSGVRRKPRTTKGQMLEMEEDEDDGLPDARVMASGGAPPSAEDFTFESKFEESKAHTSGRLRSMLPFSKPAQVHMNIPQGRLTRRGGRSVVVGGVPRVQSFRQPAIRGRIGAVRTVVTGSRSEILAKARARAPELASIVIERSLELRAHIEEAYHEGGVAGQRKAAILWHIERRFVQKYRYSSDPERLVENTARVTYHSLLQARRWERRLNTKLTREEVEREFFNIVQASHLSPMELDIYERSFELTGEISDAYDLHHDSEDFEQVSNCKLGIAITVMAAYLIIPAIYLCIFASRAGYKESHRWVVETLFILFIIYSCVHPIKIFIEYVAFPSMLDDKVRLNTKTNIAKYPFSSEMPEDAVDFLLEARPDLRALLPESDDVFVVTLRAMTPKDLSLLDLEEIELDNKIHRIGTIPIGLVVASVILNFPNMIQDLIYEELGLIIPVVVVFILRGQDLNLVEIIIITLIFCYSALAIVASIVTCYYRATLHRRDASYQKTRAKNRDFFERSSSINAA